MEASPTVLRCWHYAMSGRRLLQHWRDSKALRSCGEKGGELRQLQW